MSRRRPAYTLFELTLVAALLLVLLVIAYPSFDAMYANVRLKAAADGVQTAWARARVHAVNEGRAYRFGFVPTKGNYRVAPDSPEFWSGGGSLPGDGTGAYFLLEDALPKGVRFNTADAPDTGAETEGETALPPGSVEPSTYSAGVTFLPDGTAADDVEIVFRARGAWGLRMRLRALTGVVTVQPLKSDQER